MLIKSIKHEFRATYRMILPIFLALVLFAVVTRVAVGILIDGQLPTLVLVIAVFTALFFYLAIIAASLGVVIVNVLQFCRSLLSDQGYLNMTLPVSTHVLIFSRLFVSVCWYLLTTLVIFLCVNVAIFSSELFAAIYGDLDVAIQESLYYSGMAGQAGLLWLQMIASSVLGAVASTLLFFAAVSIGHSFHRHKVAWSILFVFVFEHVIGLLSVVGAFVTMFQWVNEISAMENMLIMDEVMMNASMFSLFNSMMGVMLLISLVESVVFYFITHYFLTKKLNLQ